MLCTSGEDIKPVLRDGEKDIENAPRCFLVIGEIF